MPLKKTRVKTFPSESSSSSKLKRICFIFQKDLHVQVSKAPFFFLSNIPLEFKSHPKISRPPCVIVPALLLHRYLGFIPTDGISTSRLSHHHFHSPYTLITMISVGSAVRLMVQLADRPQNNRGIVLFRHPLPAATSFFFCVQLK